MDSWEKILCICMSKVSAKGTSFGTVHIIYHMHFCVTALGDCMGFTKEI